MTRWEWSGEMTPERAAFVRRIRVDQGHTWRAVARLCYEEFGGDWEPPNDQMVGIELCERAAELFGEHHMRAPWN